MNIYWLNYQQKFQNGTFYKPERKVLKNRYFFGFYEKLEFTKDEIYNKIVLFI